MQIGVIGINHKLADLSLRESLSKACAVQFGNHLHDDHSFVLLSTCNRTEIYFSSDDLAATHTYFLDLLKTRVKEEFDQKLYAFFGYNCFLHLSRVASGLDSAIVAETEIQGQVKKTYEETSQSKRLPKEIHYLFQKALKIGKLIRSEYPLGRGIPNLEHAIFSLGCLEFKNPEEKKILFFGASAINQKVICYFKKKQCTKITLCNRTVKTGMEVAKNHLISFLPWEDRLNWIEFDWIIFATKSQEHLIKPKPFYNTNKKKLLIDLCVPRNVDPMIVQIPQHLLYDIDQINNSLDQRKEKIKGTLNKAENRVAKETCKQMHLFRRREKRAEFQLLALS